MHKVGDFITIKEDLVEGGNRESGVQCTHQMLHYRGITARVISMRYFGWIPLYRTCRTHYWEWADDMVLGGVAHEYLFENKY